jgi:hypothetical protein
MKNAIAISRVPPAADAAVRHTLRLQAAMPFRRLRRSATLPELPMNHTVNSLALWANGVRVGPIDAYRVTASAESAPWHAAIAGCCLALAVTTAGFWLLRHRNVNTVAGRVGILVVIGCGSVGWVAGWLWQHSGTEAVVPARGVWNFAVELPWVWFAVLGGLLVVGFFQASPQRQRYIVRGLVGAAVGFTLWIIAGNREDLSFYTIRSFVTGKTAMSEIMEHPADPWVYWGLVTVFIGGGAALGALTAWLFRPRRGLAVVPVGPIAERVVAS